MTAEWYDLGQRLHAAASGQVVVRLQHSATAVSERPVAVRATVTEGHITAVLADSTSGPIRAEGGAILTALGSLGVTMTATTPATLILDTPATLPLLDRLARTAEPGTAADDVAAHIAWWRDQGDFPGGHAVVDVVTACQTQWLTGTAPTDEDKTETWRAWLAVTDPSVSGLLDLHTRLTDGTPLPVLAVLGEDTSYTWGYAQRSHGEGRDWRWPDNTSRAALGLRSRCDAADLYAAGLLADPRYRRRAIHTGHVVTGHVERPDIPQSRRSCRVWCDRMDARLRPGTQVVGWVGGVADETTGRCTGTITAAEVEQATLVLTVSGLGGAAPLDGDPLVMHEAATSPSQLRAASKRYRALYGARRSWLTTGKPPATSRRSVPLDVLVAGADADD